MERKLVLATQNKDKAGELSALTSHLGLEVLTLDAFPSIGEIAETGETLEENAENAATQAAIVAVLTEAPNEREALEAQDEALRREGGRHVDVLYYNRAYRVLRGWRKRA